MGLLEWLSPVVALAGRFILSVVAPRLTIEWLERIVLRQYEPRLIMSYLNAERDDIAKSRRDRTPGGFRFVAPRLQRATVDDLSAEDFRTECGLGQTETQGDEGSDGSEEDRFADVSLDELPRTSSDVVMVADSGLGKTTVLQELFLVEANKWKPGAALPTRE